MTTEQHHFEYDGFTVQINDSFCIWEYRISTNDPFMCIDSFIQATKEKFSINVESLKLIASKPIFPSENKEPSIAEQPGEQDVEVEWFKQCAKAEERIQELEQEIERLKTSLKSEVEVNRVFRNCNEKDAERIKVLEDALREIERYDGVNSHHASWGDVVFHLQRVARKTITPSQHKDVNTTE